MLEKVNRGLEVMGKLFVLLLLFGGSFAILIGLAVLVGKLIGGLFV